MFIRNYKSSRYISGDISEDQEDCVRSVVKKVKEDHSIKWRKVGNEKQLKFNQSVEARFDSAISAIEKKSWIRPNKSWKRVRSFCLNVKN